MKTCSGCGVVLQSENEEKLGYTPNLEFAKCKRCFRLENYGENKHVEVPYEELLLNLNADKKESVGVLVVNIFDFDKKVLKQLINKFETTIIVFNKRDLLPKQIYEIKMLEVLKKELPGSKIFITAQKDETTINRLRNHLLTYKNKIFVIGQTNSGKSTLINKLFNTNITTSLFPNTTLDFINIKYKHLEIIDTPGFYIENPYFLNIEEKKYKKLTPKKRIKPIVYQLNSKQTIFVDKLARIDFVEGEPSNFSYYFSNEILTARTKMENAQRYERTQEVNLEVLKRFTITTKCDIVIPYLGFITVHPNQKIIIEVKTLNVDVYLRESFI